jgi:hypothetical protein
MKTETVRMCAEMTARQQLSALGHVGEDVQQLLDELATAPDGDFTIKVSVRKPKAPAAAPVAEAPAEALAEAPAEAPAAE